MTIPTKETFIIDGTATAAEIRQELTKAVEERIAKGLPRPGLAAVLIGENPASKVYVRSKRKACAEVGFLAETFTLPADATQEEAEKLVADLNADERFNGILVQLPLPWHLDDEKVLNTVSIEKDVDGFHPLNIGRLAQKGREPLFVPCTPYGCMVLLEKAGAKFEGANAVVLGRSNIVGMPAALLLVKRNATVTICHSRTKDLPGTVRQADILIAAVGRPEMVKGDWVKPGAFVIDVGIGDKWLDHPADKEYTCAVSGDTFVAHRADESEKGGRKRMGYLHEGKAYLKAKLPEDISIDDTVKLFRKYKLVGDVDYDDVAPVAGAITPVPGGVGPMTIAMLLQNTLRAAEIADEKR